MLQPDESQLSADELRVIEANQFGAPLGVYRLKSGYLRFVRIAGIFLLFLAAVMLILEILDFMKNLQTADFFLASFLLPFVSSLLFGWLLLWIEAPRAQRQHIIVCEQGLLQIGRDIRSKDIEIVRWTNILKVNRGVLGLEYSIIRRDGKILSISLYQDIEGLFELIRERTEMT